MRKRVECSQNIGLMLNSSTMCDHSAQLDCKQSALKTSMSSVGDSLVKTSVLQEKAPGSLASEAACGLSTQDVSKKSGRDTRSSKMSQPFALGDWIKCSGRSLRSGTMQSGIVYPLSPSALLTKGTGFGLWRTPTAGDSANRAFATDSRGEPKLSAQVKLWPTPTTMDHMAPKTPKAILREMMETRPGRTNLANLRDQIRWGQTFSEAKAELSDQSPSQATGQLNPTWVEWLMGFPIGWTDLSN